MHSAYIKEVPGARRAVLMIHGICSSPRHFDWLIPEFDESWSVYNILLPGHGGSVRDFANSSMVQWKEKTKQMLDMLSEKYDSILAIGYSMGTLLHIHALPHYPKVKAMLLLNCPMRPWVRWKMLTRSIRFTKGKIRQDDPHEAACIKDIGTSLTPGLWQYRRWIPRFWELLVLCRYCRKHAADITVPCAAFLGGVDELVSMRSAKYFKGNPHVTLHCFPAAGHFHFPDADKEIVLSQLHRLMNMV